MHDHTEFFETILSYTEHFWVPREQSADSSRRVTSLPNAFSLKRGGRAMSRKQSLRKEKSAAHVQNKNEANLGQKEARIEKEKTSELASMGEKSVQSEKSD
jgi:hypothetical protein